jgi:hypothetical protein
LLSEALRETILVTGFIHIVPIATDDARLNRWCNTRMNLFATLAALDEYIMAIGRNVEAMALGIDAAGLLL